MAFNIPKEITPEALASRLNNGESLLIIDVREPQEWMEGHIAGSKHIQLGQLLERQDELDLAQEMFMICRSGSRSGLACEMLSERGFNVVNMTGGLMDWTDRLV
ncbi:rhodanese-like domain-containing protein [Paenibacillus glacialis]|uniref:Sulfurtransferase n=1 Tax=Paenibacillus glacialis TaxID=494026 RepID=A0A168N2W9_9BACL|nr:rhodanese-like domain-containing protein [Paenibacillus glacialis]OAB45327.1 sulfurtransferase [Paenibacillus glacialis]